MNSTNLREQVEEMINSQFITGSVDSIVLSLKKLKYLKQFNVVSDNFYTQQGTIVAEALEELYSVDIAQLDLSDNVKKQALKEDTSWDDKVYQSKTTLQQALEIITQIVNNAYMNNESINIRCISTQELLRARLRSYNGEPYALDIVDCMENQYSITDMQIIQEIIKGRKVMFDTTYGFITITAHEIIDYGSLLFDLTHSLKTSFKKYVNFLSYSDLLNAGCDASYDDVDIYSIVQTTEWLRETVINNQGKRSNLAIYIETTSEDATETNSHVVVIGQTISNIELYIDSNVITLDKFSSGLLQRANVHTVSGVHGELVIPYSLDDTELEINSCISFPYDCITLTLQTN